MGDGALGGGARTVGAGVDGSAEVTALSGTDGSAGLGSVSVELTSVSVDDSLTSVSGDGADNIRGDDGPATWSSVEPDMLR